MVLKESGSPGCHWLEGIGAWNLTGWGEQGYGVTSAPGERAVQT